jgi:hypothetical protein
MWKKIAIGGAIAAATLGAGTAALAASGSTSSGLPTPSSTSAHGAAGAKHQGARMRLGRALHGQWVTGKAGSTTFTTHDAIRGTVSAVSPTSITVRASDKVSETYVVNSGTKVRMRTSAKGAASSIGQVKAGDQVAVIGTGTTTLTATGVIDVKK